jgi:hypothetical protein
MPIVDGYSSTKMIRSFEKTHPGSCLSPRAICNHRIPIFAVSASLVEKEKDKYIEIGFDGWLLKPVDFKRVTQLLKGITDDETRNSCLYAPGKWEQGGWFTPKTEKPDAFAVDTHPSDDKPSHQTVAGIRDEEGSEGNSLSGSATPTVEPAIEAAPES